MRKTTDKCSRSCQRSVTYEKKCIRQVTGIKVPECPGHPERHISEPCTGDDCGEQLVLLVHFSLEYFKTQGLGLFC